ncbi:chymotrypsin-like elastase family member 1 [Ranitomeya imitator]|uniref:chymotrypsin-like elastase family member 1 n=1 Tax=Ranitomeya imitator TaxID=111125 RepID=UPI001AAA80B1
MLRLLVLAVLVLCGHCSVQYIEDVEDNSRVVGGSNAAPNAWPWQVSLQYQSGSHWYHTCGGVLILANRVLTTAQCVDRDVNFRVVLGEHNLRVNEGTEQIIAVSNITKHDSFNSKSVASGNDIAILSLAESASLNSYVQLAALPADGDVLANNHECTITGWGRIRTCGFLPSILQQAPLPIVDYSTCSTSSYWGSSAKTRTVCAGGNGIQAGCKGDFGGPLNCDVDGGYQVHGLASYLAFQGCNTAVFTRVSSHIPWINSNV